MCTVYTAALKIDKITFYSFLIDLNCFQNLHQNDRFNFECLKISKRFNTAQVEIKNKSISFYVKLPTFQRE